MEYVVNHIPINKQKRTGRKITPTTLTIHSTANPRSTAINERNWLVNPDNNRSASWHIAVDEKMAVEAIPLNEQAYHAGNRAGNNTSIGIEICESGNRSRTLDNAVRLTARMLHERNWGIQQLRRHYDWSGKNCPNVLSANNWAGWHKFVSNVQKELNKLSQPREKEGKEISSWAISGRNFVVKHDISDGNNPRDYARREEIWVMIERYHKSKKEE